MKLDYHVFKSMANAYFGRYVDRERRPTFFDVKQSFPAPAAAGSTLVAPAGRGFVVFAI